MKPKIDDTDFGSITIDGIKYDHDVVIRKDGEVFKRKKKLSKRVYGTSHVISLDEAKYICEKNVKQIIMGSGQYKMLSLSKEATEYFKKEKCSILMESTPEAMKLWNESKHQHPCYPSSQSYVNRQRFYEYLF